MADGTLDDLYLAWLYEQVVRPQRLTYWSLLRQLYKIEFTWFVPNDGNRAEDGKDLRHEWQDRLGIPVDPDWMKLPCSFLEMLVALSRRMEFEAEESPEYWFFDLLENLGFQGYHDNSGYSRNDVTRQVQIVLDRQYDKNGRGGLFPIIDTSKDQRRVELWYQMSEYLLQGL